MLLVGGASTRFGSPKALALFEGQTLAERAWATLGEVCVERIAVGKLADGLVLPFPLLEDGSATRAPLAGVVAGLRAAEAELTVVVPVDCPRLTARSLSMLAAACSGDVAVPQTGPLPGAYRRTALPALERALQAGRLSLRHAIGPLAVATVDLDDAELANANTPEALAALEARRPARHRA